VNCRCTDSNLSIKPTKHSEAEGHVAVMLNLTHNNLQQFSASPRQPNCRKKLPLYMYAISAYDTS